MDGDLRLIYLCLLFVFFHHASVSHGIDLLVPNSKSFRVLATARGDGAARTHGWLWLPPASPKQIILHLRRTCSASADRFLTLLCGDLSPDLYIYGFLQQERAHNKGHRGYGHG